MKYLMPTSFAFVVFVAFSSAASAQCVKAAINPIMSGVTNALKKERDLLRGAVDNHDDAAIRDTYIRQWGYPQPTNNYLAPAPTGARTDTNEAIAGLVGYLNSCAQ